jgi:hypothetical protein
MSQMRTYGPEQLPVCPLSDRNRSVAQITSQGGTWSSASVIELSHDLEHYCGSLLDGRAATVQK